MKKEKAKDNGFLRLVRWVRGGNWGENLMEWKEGSWWWGLWKRLSFLKQSYAYSIRKSRVTSLVTPSLTGASCSCCQSINTHPSSHPGAGAHWIALNTHFRIDRQSPEVRDCVLFISIFLAWHSALARIRHSVNDADWMHELEDIEEKALMALLQNLSVLEVFIHIFMCLIDTHAPSVRTRTSYHFLCISIW